MSREGKDGGRLDTGPGYRNERSEVYTRRRKQRDVERVHSMPLCFNAKLFPAVSIFVMSPGDYPCHSRELGARFVAIKIGVGLFAGFCVFWSLSKRFILSARDSEHPYRVRAICTRRARPPSEANSDRFAGLASFQYEYCLPPLDTTP